MFASKWTDMVIGLDIHFEMVPVPPAPAPVPMPFPNPFIGIVFDPIGLAVGQAVSAAMAAAMGGAPSGIVTINGFIATNIGTEAMGMGHILFPPGVAWAPMPKFPSLTFRGPPDFPGPPVKPEDDAVAVMGSQTVTVMGSSAVRMPEVWMSCSEPIRSTTSVVIAPPKGPPVLIGGPPAISLLDAIMAMIRTKWVAGYLHSAISRINNARVRNVLSFFACIATGHPVDVMTGRMWTEQKDFELSGPMPLKFTRIYASSWSHRDGPLGPGWSHSLDQAVWTERGKVVYLAEDGREIEFDVFDLPGHRLSPGEEVFDPINALTLRYRAVNLIEIETLQGQILEFAPVAMPAGPRSRWWRIQKKRTRDGHEILFAYDKRGNLEWVRDSGGRLVGFEHDAQNRLISVNLPHPSQDGWVRSFQYVYDDEGDLVQAVDALGRSLRYAYQRHLMVQETNRNGLSFYFAYDGFNSEAYCVRTWGDGGIYDHHITYSKEEYKTLVEDSLGNTTIYQGNALGLVTSITDAHGGVTNYEFDERTLKKTKEVTPLGHEVTWEYDARGNLVETVGPDGGALKLEYDANNLPIKVIDQAGGAWAWTREPNGTLREMVDPLGRVTRFTFRGRWLVGMIDAAGGTTRLDYDAAGNLASITTPNGAATYFAHDRRGRLVAVTDPTGNVQRRYLDELDRVVRVDEPQGNVRSFTHDAEGNVTHIKDQHEEVQFTYQGMNRIASRAQAGTTVGFEYDTEERLTAVRNEHGHVVRLVLDAVGNVVEEIGFDGLRRAYAYDAEGRVVRTQRPPNAQGSRHCEYEYDPVGRMTKVTYSEGATEHFEYRADGALMAAITDDIAVRFERDPLGRITKESQGQHWVESEYDALGLRNRMRSSLGADQLFQRDLMGDVMRVVDHEAKFEASFSRDQLGLELERVLPGGVRSRWERDKFGRPTQHRVDATGKQLRAVAYQWESNNRLKMVIDALTGVTEYGRDSAGNLAWARYSDGTVDLRMPDAIGNLFRSSSRDDRRYGPAGQLMAARTAHGWVEYKYDTEGNLTEKIEPTGRQWLYEWNAAGRLVKTIRPDGSEVVFQYDALGRRVSKRFRGQTTSWVWDGDNPLHEWVEGQLFALPDGDPPASWSPDIEVKRREAELQRHLSQGPPLRGTAQRPITWLFEPDTFSPLAKLVDGKAYSIITDHTGTPVLMTHADGSAAWSASISVYGDLRQVEGDRYTCPFRWSGQYEDAETGLCYNRFRYYDPEAGEYLTRDPMGLLGGLHPYGYVADPTRLVDPYGLTAEQLAADMAENHRPLDPGQTAHHIVKENAQGMAEHSRSLLERNGVGVNDSPNGARLWGSHPDQVATPGHPGRDAARAAGNYHGGVHIHGKANDRLIYRILRAAEKKGLNVADVLADIGRRMESGEWKKTGQGGCY